LGIAGMTRGILMLFMLMFAVRASAAEIYTWTDAAGLKHFSDVQPASGQDAKIIVVEPTPAAADPAAARARAMQQLERQREAVKALRRAQSWDFSTASMPNSRMRVPLMSSVSPSNT